MIADSDHLANLILKNYCSIVYKFENLKTRCKIKNYVASPFGMTFFMVFLAREIQQSEWSRIVREEQTQTLYFNEWILVVDVSF